MITNIAAYQFASLHGLKVLRDRLLTECKSWGLKGTILLSTEGINLFVAGNRLEIDLLVNDLRSIPELAGLAPKYSDSAHQPFTRMLVRIKKEIISFGVDGIDPSKHTSPKLDAKTLKQWLDEGRPFTLLDTRNDYEVKLGTFKGAVTLGIDHFKQFPAAVDKLPAELKQQPVVMFCTGGIRCEKAGPFMEREGFEKIYQLNGGILKYFEECGSEHYDGDCFVFDHRVGVDPDLRQTEAALCFVCQSPLTEEDQADARFVPSVSCPYCFKTAREKMVESIARRHEAIRKITNPLPGGEPRDNLRPLNVPARCDGMSFLEMLVTIFPHEPETQWEQLCGCGGFQNDSGQLVSGSQIVRSGERLYRVQPGFVEPEVNVNIRIIHEDEALIILNKPAPLPMHPGGRFNRNTLQHILDEVYAPQKVRAAHRLDANTTGLVAIARTRHFASLLQPQFTRGEVEKVYLARVNGHPAQDAFSCDAPISDEPGPLGSRAVDSDGRTSFTDFKVLRRNPDQTSLLEVRPRSGRTNQIRIHLWHLGFSICGDPTYLSEQSMGDTQTLPVGSPPLCLQSAHLAFAHPLTKERVVFQATLPSWAHD